jgi:hypothetical protein
MLFFFFFLMEYKSFSKYFWKFLNKFIYFYNYKSSLFTRVERLVLLVICLMGFSHLALEA